MFSHCVDSSYTSIANALNSILAKNLLIVAVFVLLTVGVILFIVERWRFAYWANRNVPHAAGRFPMGSFNEMGSTLHFNDVLSRVYQQHKASSTFAGLYVGFIPTLLVTSLDLVKQILVKDFNNFHDRGMYVNEQDDPLSAHLFSLAGDKWRFLRNKLSPTFTSVKIKQMLGAMREIVDEFVHCLDKHVQASAPANMKSLCQRFTCDVIGSCAFGLKTDSLKNEGSQMFSIADQMFKPSRLQALWIFVLMSFRELSVKLGLSVTPKAVSRYFLKVVAEAVAHREESKLIRQDFLQLLIQLKNHGSIDGEEQEDSEADTITINQIAAQSFVFFLAGFETTSSALSFALLELAINPDIQAKTREEVKRVVAAHDGKISYEALKDMTYLQQVVNEILRMYPPGNVLNRSATSSYKLPDSDLTAEKDTMLLISVYAIHHDPELYPDPSRFDPDRFTQEAIAARHSHSFLPFGDGPRNCIGMRFALLMVKFGIAQLLSRFSFSLNERMALPVKLNIKVPMIEVDGEIWLDVSRI